MSDSPIQHPGHGGGDAANVAERQPHAVLDLPSRRFKGLKIERLLSLASRPQPIRMLEVGTGSGGIAHYFGTHPTLRCDVEAVDVHDNRLVTVGYRYQQVHGVRLPFTDESFDVVLTNHVIEHVGGDSAQRAHLAEVHRVLRSDGVGYLAVPNRWMLVEPHYHLIFLSWLPHSWRSSYLRLMRKGKFYDCEPLEARQLERMLDGAGFGYSNLCIEAMRETVAIERSQALFALVLSALPNGVLGPLRGLIPTLIYRLERR